MKSKFVFSLAFLLALSTLVLAQKKSDNIYQTDAGAIKGYDPVAYFTDSKPVKGDTAFKTDWNGATWYFASAEHLAAFKADPTKYAPQYGGYCAYGMSEEHKAPVEPEAWSIVNGKLYLNYNMDVQKEWKKKDADLIIKADANWAKIKK